MKRILFGILGVLLFGLAYAQVVPPGPVYNAQSIQSAFIPLGCINGVNCTPVPIVAAVYNIPAPLPLNTKTLTPTGTLTPSNTPTPTGSATPTMTPTITPTPNWNTTNTPVVVNPVGPQPTQIAIISNGVAPVATIAVAEQTNTQTPVLESAVGPFPTAIATLYVSSQQALTPQIPVATQIAIESNAQVAAATAQATAYVSGQQVLTPQIPMATQAAIDSNANVAVATAVATQYVTGQQALTPVWTQLVAAQQALTPIWTQLVTGQQILTPVVAQATAIGTVYTSVQALNTPAYQNTPGGGYSSQTKQANESNTPTTNGSTHIDIGGVYDQVPVHLTPGWGSQAAVDSTKAWYVNTEGNQYTYVATGTWTPSIAAAGLDLQIIGVASQRWHILHLYVRGDVTTAVLQELQVTKYSTAGTAGTVVGAVTPIAFDSNDPAPGILVKPYSTPATPGTALSLIYDNKLAFDAVGVVPTFFGDTFADLIPQCSGCKGVVLNSASENIGIVAPSALGTGTVLYFLAVMTRE